MRTYLVPRRILDHRLYVEEERRYVRDLTEFFEKAKKEAETEEDLALWKKISKIVSDLNALEKSMTNRISFLEELSVIVTQLQKETSDITDDIRGMLKSLDIGE